MVKCPYCSQPAISLARMAGLGPGRAVPCQSCGKPVATHWAAIFAAIPAFLGGTTLLKSDSLLIGMAAVAAGLASMALIQTFVIPLMRTDG